MKLWILELYRVTTSIIQYTGDCYMQANLTVNIRAIFGKLFSDRDTQGDRYIQSRYIQVRLYFG